MITMKSKFSRLSLHTSLFIIISVALIPLIISIFKSGYAYVFDNDELNHAQLIFLYANGSRPYLDIYNSVYSPLFGWFLLPIYQLLGFTFSTLYMTRYVMIILFAIRVIVSFVMVYRVFGRRIAYLFVAMFLLDPFVIFSSMQARPDNLMMTVYSVGLLFYVRAILRPSTRGMFIAASCMALSLLILPKLVPSIGIIIAATIIFFSIKKKPAYILSGLFGFLVPLVLFSFYFLVHGSFEEMIKQSLFEAKAAYSYFSIMVPLGNFYIPDNFYIYGSMGKPLTWFYAWFLPFGASIGIFITIQHYLERHSIDQAGMLKIILGITLLVQWGVLFFLQVVFMQHYLPISWLYGVFAAVFIDSILTMTSRYRTGHIATSLLLFIVCMTLVHTSVKANNARSYVNSTELINRVTKRWQQIPEGTYTFPNYLFRPSMYPITYGYFIGNVPPVILNRLPPITARIEEYDVQYLLVDDYLMGKLPAPVRTYITAHYARVPGDNELMVRHPAKAL